MTSVEMLKIVQSQLALDLNCTVDDINGTKDGFVFTELCDIPGRRPFPRNDTYFEMLSMGKSIIVTASPNNLESLKELVNNKDRDEAFSACMPFVQGFGLYYLPDLTCIKPLTAPVGYEYEVVEQKNIHALYKLTGFQNAIQYDVNCPRPDALVKLAKKDGHVIGMAGASIDCAKMWQVGMDVLPDHRGHGLAAYLVNWLTLEILNRGYVPYYGTALSNIASQRVAHRAGYAPAWVNTYEGELHLHPQTNKV